MIVNPKSTKLKWTLSCWGDVTAHERLNIETTKLKKVTSFVSENPKGYPKISQKFREVEASKK